MEWTLDINTGESVEAVNEANAALGRLRASLADTAPFKAYSAASDAAGKAAAKVGAAVDKAAGAVRSVATKAAAPFRSAMETVRGAATKAFDAVKGTKAFGVLRDVATVAGFVGGRALGGVGGAAKAAYGVISSGASTVGRGLGAVAGAARTVGGKIGEAFSGAGNSLGKLLGPLKGAAPLLLAGVGAAGVAGLAKIAIGARGVAGLQAIAARTQLGFAQLFRGVDASPLLRAAERLSRNLTGQTVTGRALGDVLTRSFNGIFRAVEAAEPYVTAFGQGIVLAFLYAENAVLRARVALSPYTGALEGVVSSTTAMRVAAVLGGAAVVALAGYAVVAAAPFLALAAAIAAVSSAVEQASKLMKEWDDNSGTQIWNKLKQDLGVSQGEVRGLVTGDEYLKQSEAKARAAGQATGKAMGDGMVAGMSASEAAARAGGEKLAKAAEAGAKAAAEIRSPSRKMRREVGRQLGEGVALGQEDMAGRVQRSAASSLVPDPATIPGLATRGGGSVTGPLLVIERLIVQGTDEMQERVEDALDAVAARVGARFGLVLSTGS